MGVERAAEARFRLGKERRKRITAAALALCRFDLVGAKRSAIDAIHEGRRAVTGVEALVWVNVTCGVGIRGDLPAAAVNRLQPGLYHLDGLIPGHGSQSRDVSIGVHEVPEAFGAQARTGLLHLNRPPTPTYSSVRHA